jgi:hypothetical protein
MSRTLAVVVTVPWHGAAPGPGTGNEGGTGANCWLATKRAGPAQEQRGLAGKAATRPSRFLAADTPGMAGLSGEQAVIDVVALSERLCPSTSNETASRLEPPPGVPTEIASSCPLGHPNAPGMRFCGACGLPVGASIPVRGEPQRPKPAAELTPAEKADREREHAAAVAAAAQFESAPQQYVPAEGEAVLIHFVADGLTAFGQVWYRGQELSIGPDHPRWTEALGWITLNRWQQADRWGEQKFDFGPWPGRSSYAEAYGSFEQLFGRDAQGNKVAITGPTVQQLRDADEAERRRGRAVPAPAFG